MRNRIATTLLFGAGGNAQPYLRGGWGEPEAGFTWTDGEASRLVLPVVDAPHGFFLEFELLPFLAETVLPRQRLRVLVDDRPVGMAVTTAYGMLAWFVPPPVPAVVRVTLLHPDATSPHELGLNTDTRRLAQHVTRCRVLVPLAPFPGFSGRTASGGSMDGSAEVCLAFESLGENCEFGAVQRACGHEPLGLLRFSSGPLPLMVKGIDSLFDGLEDVIEPYEERNGEWMMIDRRYGIVYHTFINSAQQDAAHMRQRERKKTSFLREKFLRDLTEGEKIFVHQRVAPTQLAEIVPLWLAVGRRGTGRLLWVSPGGTGTATEIYPDLVHAGISPVTPPGTHGEAFPEAWLPALNNALTLFRTAQPAA